MTDAFDLMSNSIFDNIITTGDDLDEIWQSDFTRMDIQNIPELPETEDFYQENCVEIEANNVHKSPNVLYNGYIRHDCMWSGTCVDPAHPSKKKIYRFCANEGDHDEPDQVETTVENNLPSAFQTFNRNIQQDPAGVFQEILQNASQSNKTNIRQSTGSKVSPQEFSQLQQTYNNIPIIYPNSVPKTFIQPAEIKNEQIMNASIKFEPITVEPSEIVQSEPASNKMLKIDNIRSESMNEQHIPVITEQSPAQSSFIKEEPLPISYYPQVKYEPVSIVSFPFFVNCSNNYDNNNHPNNPTCFAHDDVYGTENYKATMDRKKHKSQKKKSQAMRRGIKKSTKIKKNRAYDEIYGEGGSKRRPRSSNNASSDENPIEKRNMHNSMERQRRIGLKNLFIELKQAIPTLDEKERVPKVSILREAISYCNKLNEDEKLLDELKRKHNKLMTQFHKLHKIIIN